jgi:hypothetical protein
MVVDFRWAAGSQENVPFVNNVAKFSTPGIWCLQNLRVRVKDTSKQEAGAIFKPGKKNSDNGYFLAIYCESRTFSLTDDGVQS